MRYTRYDYKRKKGGNFFIWLILIIILAVVIGTGIFKLFLNGEKEKINIPKSPDSSQSNLDNSSEKIFGIIQCGLYSNKEGAEGAISELPSDFSGFIVEENGKYKVMAGIFEDSLVESKMSELTNVSINNFRIKCKLNQDSSENKSKSEILTGYLKVINGLYEKDVKSIDTSKFKSWAQDTVDKLDKKDKELEEILSNIKGLPENYNKENSKDSMNFLYNLLIKYKA